MESKTADHYARIIWDYMLMHHELKPADGILVLGTSDTRVAERGAELYHAHYAPLVVTTGQPYTERRTWATAQKFWPEVEWMITSPQIPYEEYVTSGENSKQWFLESLVGDLQRIKEYPKQGFQIEQKVPEPVWRAWEELVRLGYTRRLLKT